MEFLDSNGASIGVGDRVWFKSNGIQMRGEVIELTKKVGKKWGSEELKVTETIKVKGGKCGLLVFHKSTNLTLSVPR